MSGQATWSFDAAKKLLLEQFLAGHNASYWRLNFPGRTFERMVDDKGAPKKGKPSEAQWTRFLASLDIDSAALLEVSMNRLEKENVPFKLELKIDQPTDGVLWIAMHGLPVMGEKSVEGAFGITYDITEQVNDRLRLKKSEQRFKALFNQTFQFVVLLDKEGRLLRANETALEFGGFGLDEVKGIKLWETPWWSIHKDKKQTMEAVGSAALGKQVRFETDLVGIGNNTVRFDFSMRPVRDDDNEVTQLIVEGKDISDKREVYEQLILLNHELERKIEDRTAELKESNDDLESFAYSVSHDLRAPLRAINGFSRILLEDYSKSLDAEGNRLLATIGDNAMKMARLIDDLLLFSRTTRSEIHLAAVDMAKVFWRALQELTSSERYEKSIVTIGNLPVARADERMFYQVALNLLGNALKYSSTKDEPVIDIQCSTEDNFFVFCVTDNGVGFDPHYASGLFSVFHRLHSAKSFEGTGVGLSIVKKIVEKHGGRVWATGQLGKGASFYFTLPILDPHERSQNSPD